MRKDLIVGFIAASLIACTAAAPSDPSDPEGAKSGQQGSTEKPTDGSSGGATSSGGTSSGGTSSGGTGDAGSAGACSGSAGIEACFECCEKANPQGLAKEDAAYEAHSKCACAADACGTACAKSFYCNGDDDPTAACDECMEKNAKAKTCNDAFDTALNDPDVAKLEKCIEDAKCTDAK